MNEFVHGGQVRALQALRIPLDTLAFTGSHGEVADQDRFGQATRTDGSHLRLAVKRNTVQFSESSVTVCVLLWPKAMFTVAWGNAPGTWMPDDVWPKAIFTGCLCEYGLRPKRFCFQR